MHGSLQRFMPLQAGARYAAACKARLQRHVLQYSSHQQAKAHNYTDAMVAVFHLCMHMHMHAGTIRLAHHSQAELGDRLVVARAHDGGPVAVACKSEPGSDS
jgi:hypothetical protein